ncbi:MAG: WYL domain-containing protein [bacterium]|nr:WYL domain-containing protein [bacterium]
MEDFEPKKLAILRILQILRHYSDKKHKLTHEQVAEILAKEYGIQSERKAIGRNISLLRDAGFDIVTEHTGGSYLASDKFADSELHLIIDGILSSKHITAEHSRSLVERLCTLTNKYFRSNINYIFSANDWNKTDNKELFKNIETVDTAIELDLQITFDYNKYGLDKKMHKTRTHRVSPYQMVLHNQRYYLMGYSTEGKKIIFFRLDHITNISISDSKIKPITEIPGFEKGIDFKDLSQSRPYMYSDKPVPVEFIADYSIIDQIIDWFGDNARIRRYEYDETKIKVRLNVSPEAMKLWALQYAMHVEIIDPAPLRLEILRILKQAAERYSR